MAIRGDLRPQLLSARSPRVRELRQRCRFNGHEQTGSAPKRADVARIVLCSDDVRRGKMLLGYQLRAGAGAGSTHTQHTARFCWLSMLRWVVLWKLMTHDGADDDDGH